MPSGVLGLAGVRGHKKNTCQRAVILGMEFGIHAPEQMPNSSSQFLPTVQLSTHASLQTARLPHIHHQQHNSKEHNINLLKKKKNLDVLHITYKPSVCHPTLPLCSLMSFL